MGVWGTDAGIVQGLYGVAPEDRERLILGRESLGEVLEAPPGSGFSPGDLLVGVVRRPDPAWLSRLITHRVPLERSSDALRREPGDVKVVIDFKT